MTITNYKRLENSDISAPPGCLGTVSFGLINNIDQSFALMDYAYDRGINFFDTAEMYPSPPSHEHYRRSGEIIGKWLNHRHLRNKIIIATKVNGPVLPLFIANLSSPMIATIAIGLSCAVCGGVYLLLSQSNLRPDSMDE